MAADQPESDSDYDNPPANELVDWHEVAHEQLPVDPYLQALDNQSDFEDDSQSDSSSDSDYDDVVAVPREPRNDAAQESYMEEVRQMLGVILKSSAEEQERFRVDPEYREEILGNPNHRRRIVEDFDRKAQSN